MWSKTSLQSGTSNRSFRWIISPQKCLTITRQCRTWYLLSKLLPFISAGLDNYTVNYYYWYLQDCAVSVQQQGAAFITTGGFDVLFSLLQEYHNQASWDDQLLFSQSWIVSAELFLQDFNFFSQAASSDLKQLGFSVATRGMENAVEELSQLLNSNSQLVESDDRWLSWRQSAEFSAERHQTSPPYPALLT